MTAGAIAAATLAAVTAAGALATMAAPIAGHPAPACAPADGLGFICGPVASEDLVHVPGTGWLIASGLRTDRPGQLYRIDTRTRHAAVQPITLRPDPAIRRGCPAAPARGSLSIDGLAIRRTGSGRHIVYAANHGDREAIEMFDLTIRAGMPRMAWIGCVTMPAGTLANAIAPLPDGGMIVSSFYDPRDPGAWTRMARGEPTGSLWEWHRGSGFRRIDAGPISGANGLALSADARTLYVSAWSGRALLALDRRSGRRRTVPLDFLPDNIKRSADGTLLVAGQASDVASIAACNGPTCPRRWVIARIDPRRRTVTRLIERRGNATVSYACGAIEVGDMLYITARADRRLIVVARAALPSLR